MADPVPTPGDNSKQPAAATPAPDAAKPAVPAQASGNPPPPSTPVVEKPTEGAKPAEAPKPAEPAPAEAAKPAEGAKPAEEPKPAAATIPEKYEIAMPDFVPKDTKLDTALIDGMTPVFKELGLTNAQAQKLADAAIKYQMGLPQAMLARDLDATLKDKDIGQMHWPRTQGRISLALGAFTNANERAWLERAGIGNRLEFVRVFERIGAAMEASGDTFTRGEPTSAEELSMADRVYGKKKAS